MSITVPLQVMGLSAGYATALGWLERRFPSIKPDHIWAEVAGGVLVTLLPVSLAAHRKPPEPETTPISWQSYEGAVWRSFCAAAVPIVLWQLAEAVLRHTELLSYSYSTHHASDKAAVSHGNCAGGVPGAGVEDVESESPASELKRYLHDAHTRAEEARARMHHNPGLALMLMSEASQAATSALSRLARLQERSRHHTSAAVVE
jgi:hypothetical protein